MSVTTHVAVKHDSEKAVAAAPHQQWHYDAKTGFITAFDGRVLDVEGGSKAQGAKLILWDKKPGGDASNQQFEYKDGSFYTKMGTGFVIDISGGKIADGAELILWAPHGGANQKWDIDSFGFIRSRANNKFVIDLNGGKPGKGLGKVTLWTGAASKEQADLAHKLQQHQHQRWHYDNKTGFITAFDGRVLDVDGGSKAEGAKLIVWPKKQGGDATNQQFEYKDGSFYSKMGTGFVIDISGGKFNDAAEIILWRSTGGANQKWDIDQYGFIRSRGNGKFGLDVSGGAKPSQGASKVCLYTVGHLTGGL